MFLYRLDVKERKKLSDARHGNHEMLSLVVVSPV